MIHNSHIMVDGQFVSQKHHSLVRAIKDYEPELDVRWIPPGQRSEGEAAFAIVHMPEGHPEYVLFYVPTEEEFDERVLARIIYNDQRKTGQQQYTDLEAAELAAKTMERAAYEDAMAEAADISQHILRTHLNTYKVNDGLVIKDGIPFNVAKRKD